MIKHQHLLRSNHFYCALLALYPERFRVRFGSEMALVFNDCCRSACGNGRVNLLAFWLRTLQDLGRSLPREWRQEFLLADGELDYTGMADLFMTAVVVGANLLGWGWLGTGITLSLADLQSDERATSLFVLEAAGFVMAILIGLLSALLVARGSRRSRSLKV